MTLIRLLRNERLPIDRLLQTQRRKLRSLARHAYKHVEFYRQLFDDVGIKPEDIRSEADLQVLPIVDKQMMRAIPVESLLDDRIDKKDLIIRRTSGSSGVPFDVYRLNSYDTHCKAQAVRPYITNGRSVFGRVFRLTAHAAAANTWFQRFGLMREVRATCGRDPKEILELFTGSGADYVMGYPSAVTALATEIQRQEASFKPPKIVFTDSELLTPFVRQQIEATFRAPVIDVYGTWETDNIAYECDMRSGHHLAIDCVVAEVVRNERCVPPGETGSLVCTVLDNYAMPFIRYNSGDLVSMSDTHCACGRTLPIINIVDGRADDQIVMPDSLRQSSRQLLRRLLEFADLLFQYRIVQSDINEFQMAVVPRRQLSGADEERLVGVFRSTHPDARVSISVETALPPDKSGKLRAFESRV